MMFTSELTHVLYRCAGRLKGPEYVSLTTQVYRHAIDAAWEALHGGTGAADTASASGVEAQQTAAGGLSRAEVAAAAERAKAAVLLTDAQRRELEQVGGATHTHAWMPLT